VDVAITALVILATAGLAYAINRAIAGPAVHRAFAHLPLTAAADITEPGRYRLTGRVVPIGEPPTSEASSRQYVARDLRIVESAGDSGSTRPSQQVVDFLLDDGTTRVLVRAEHAVFTIDRDFEAPTTTLDQVPWVETLLRAGGYRNGSPATCKIRVYEGVLAPGAHAGVAGYAEPADEYASSLGAASVIRSQPGTPVMIRAEAPTKPEDS